MDRATEEAACSEGVVIGEIGDRVGCVVRPIATQWVLVFGRDMQLGMKGRG